MTREQQQPPFEKRHQLRSMGCLNPQPEKVKDELFRTDPFFDPCDLVQLKYEMIRRVHTEKHPISTTVSDFGFSRVSFYQMQNTFKKDGLVGLVAKKRGPRTRHKITQTVLSFIQERMGQDSTIKPVHLCSQIKERFGLQIHPRSIRRALAAIKKKMRQSL